MKKELIIAICVMLLLVGLTGCVEQPSDENTNLQISDCIQLYNGTLYTAYYVNETNSDIVAGFFEYPDSAKSVTYIINVPVRNIADKMIYEIKYDFSFYDDESNLLLTLSEENIYLLEPGNTTTLNVQISSNSSMDPALGPFTPYFDEISDYKVEVTDVIFEQ